MHIGYSRHIVLFAITLSTLLCFPGSTQAQDTELHMITATHLTNQTVREYRKDAARLALSHLANGRSLLELDIRIPEDVQASLFNALMSIHNSTNPYAQKVTSLGIHTKAKPYYIDRIEIDCTPETTWTAPLRSGGTTTTNKEINSQLSEYELEIDDYDKEENSFVLSARNPLNMSKLASDLSELNTDITFILIPETNETDHNIEAEHVDGDTWIITFYKGSNKWSFKTDGERVIYLKR